MFRAIKSESIKYFSGKMIYICIFITMSLAVLDYGAPMLIMKLDATVGGEIANQFQNMTSQEYILKSLLGLFSGGIIFIIITIISTSMISEDYAKGTMKYSLLAVSKQELILGKIITAGIINAVLTISALISASVIGGLAFEWGSNSYSVMQIIGGYFLGWLALLGFTCLIMFMIMRINNMGGAIGVGIGLYCVRGILGQLLPEAYSFTIITANFYKIINMNMASWGEIAATNLSYIVIFTGLSLIIFRKKEILS